MQRNPQRALLPSLARAAAAVLSQRRIRICLSLFALVACGRGDVVSDRAVIDATPVRAVPAFATLVGTWNGSAQIPSSGLATVVATGVVTIDASGAGSFFVSVAGVSKSGQLEILGFNGSTIRGRALGIERHFSVQVEAARMQLQVPEIGTVVLLRSR